MKKTFSYFLIFALGIGLGATMTIAGAAENTQKPAYMIVSSDRLPGADYGPYLSAAGPLAREAGLQIVAASQPPVVLEGNWPYKNITLEVYPSMDALNKFWYSDAYQAAKKLREGLSDMNFIVAVEGN